MVYIISNPNTGGGGYILAASAQTVKQAIQCACDCIATDIKLHGASCGYIVADECETYAHIKDGLTESPHIIQHSPPRRTSETVRRSIIAQRGFFREGGGTA